MNFYFIQTSLIINSDTYVSGHGTVYTLYRALYSVYTAKFCARMVRKITKA
jgi:hypothetical protein